MKTNPLYKGLLDKSIASMISAIEIYNKPDFQYREETFTILAINAWELLFKAHILKLSNYKTRSIYELQPATLKDGSLSKTRKVIAKNRIGNPKTISILIAISILESRKLLPKNLRDNVEALIELRDNAVHFYNMNPIARPIQELGFACIRNYIAILKAWSVPIDLHQYNLFLMPLAYIDEKKFVESALTDEQGRYIQLLQEKLKHKDKDGDYDIAISIELDFKKGNSIEAIGMKFDPNGVSVTLSEEERKSRYPHTYKEIVGKCKERYSDFKCGTKFNEIMKEIKKNDKLAYNRKLYPNNPKSQIATFYNAGIMHELDNHYTRK